MDTQREPHAVSLKGETFSCTLCANNERPNDTRRKVLTVNIDAEMQAPTQTLPLDLSSSEGESTNSDLDSGGSLQKLVRFDLKEEGNHVLAVSVTYTELRPDNGGDFKERTRTFRKLYQFVAAPCLSVRTKVSDFPLRGIDSEYKAKVKHLSVVMEAQLENMADGPITLEEIGFSPKDSFRTTSIQPDDQGQEYPFLQPRDVTQVAFVIKQLPRPPAETTKDGRIILGQLKIQWRTSMGDPGFLTTGWLTTRNKP
ncbi:MAG: hypothetical protein Q9174_000379 [Haloplaca sp. 1 TL-2023]